MLLCVSTFARRVNATKAKKTTTLLFQPHYIWMCACVFVWVLLFCLFLNSSVRTRFSRNCKIVRNQMHLQTSSTHMSIQILAQTCNIYAHWYTCTAVSFRLKYMDFLWTIRLLFFYETPQRVLCGGNSFGVARGSRLSPQSQLSSTRWLSECPSVPVLRAACCDVKRVSVCPRCVSYDFILFFYACMNVFFTCKFECVCSWEYKENNNITIPCVPHTTYIHTYWVQKANKKTKPSF